MFSIDVIDEILEEKFDPLIDEGSEILHSIEGTILEEKIFAEFDEFMAMNIEENSESESETEEPSFEKITFNTDYKIKTSLEEPPSHLELKLVENGIVLGHKVSDAGLEVDKAKIDVISKLPPPTNVKGIRSFLEHAGFYRCFIKDFSKIARPLTKLLEKDTPFEFNDECHKAFSSLKEKLTCTPVIMNPNLNLPFELMCDASEFVVRAVLGQKDETSDDSDVGDNFPGETLMEITTKDIPTAYKTPTGTTPYKLLYGKNYHLPFEIEHRAYWALKNCNPDLIAAGEKRMFQLHELDELRHQAYENSRLYKARTKVWHDRKLKMRKEFKKGNKVLLFHSKYKFK
ncbi:reverse transcriptase domain-containing protein [Tanacetum coccineum]